MLTSPFYHLMYIPYSFKYMQCHTYHLLIISLTTLTFRLLMLIYLCQLQAMLHDAIFSWNLQRNSTFVRICEKAHILRFYVSQESELQCKLQKKDIV